MPVYGAHLKLVYANMLMTIFTVPFINYTTLYDPIGVFMLRIIGYLIVSDTLFYWIHRFSHTNKHLWKYHKKHHEFQYPSGITAIYAHPIDFILTNLLPFLCGPALFGYSLHTLIFWLTLVIFNAVISHSSLNFPIYYDANHGIHHVKRNVNFGFILWDKICKTKNDN